MSVVLRTAQDIVGSVGANVAHTTNRLFPPKQREHALETLRAFSVRNPKLAVFLAAQTALAGLPVLLFFAFAVSTLVVSLITCILLGVFAAFVFTLLITGLALLFVVPVVFVGSCTASIVFLWGLVGYLVLQRINGGETPVLPGTKFGGTLNGLTGGRLHDLADRRGSHPQQECLAVDSSRNGKASVGQRKDDNTCSHSPHRRPNGQANGVSHGGEAGQEGTEGGTRNAQVATRNVTQGERDHPELDLSTYEPTMERLADWKTEFQQEILTA